jgi:hypothetical protein
MFDVHAAQQTRAGGSDDNVVTVILQQNAEPARHLRRRHRIPKLAGEPRHFSRVVYPCVPDF